MNRFLVFILGVFLLSACTPSQIATPTLLPDQTETTPSIVINTLEARSMKGYELYSWQADGVWNFALLIGTNRMKTIDEVLDPATRLTGVEALKGQLNHIAAGEYVFWLNLQNEPKLSLPPEEMIKEIQTYCTEHELKLSLSLQ